MAGDEFMDAFWSLQPPSASEVQKTGLQIHPLQ